MPPNEPSHGAPVLPLTRAQEGIWLGQQLEPTSPRYNAAECIALPVGIDVERLHAAVVRAVHETEALRMRYCATPEGPRQWREDPPMALPVVSLTESEAQVWMREDLARPIDLAHDPLYRGAIVRTEARVYWYHAAHHIALDGYGFSMVARRAAELYTLPSADASFGSLQTVVDEDHAYATSPAADRDRAFWHAELAGMQNPVSFCAQAASSAELPLRQHLALPPALQSELAAIAKQVRGTWGDAMIAALALTLARSTGADEVVLGLPVMNRLGSAALKVPCMAMNIVPLRLTLGADVSFLGAIERVVARLRALRPHSRYRYEQLRRELGLVGGDKRLFGPVVNLMPFDLDLRFAGERASIHNLSAGPVDDLALAVTTHGDGAGLKLELDANPRQYRSEDVARIERALREALAEGVRTPTAAPREAVVYGPALPEPAEDVIAAFMRQVRERPEAIALEAGAERISYRELHARARKLAARLRQRGLGRDDLVALELPRSCDAIAAQLGVLMAGAAYLPLDVDGPSGRREAILEDAGPKLIVGKREHRELPLLRMEDCEEAPDQELACDPAALAYVIYTSGSTGQPNGVAIERAALSHFTAAARARYGFTADDRVLQFAPLHFDACVEEIFGALCIGATLVLRDDAMLASLPAFARACSERRLTVLDLPTAFFHELAYALSTGTATLPDCLRIVIIGGEAALPERVARFRATAHPALRLFNTYGPTEATVVATSAVLAGEGALEGVPIGTPLPGIGTLIADERGAPVRAGTVGELLLLGPTLARGYLRRDALQARRFVELPGCRRAYRTGDRVRREAGQLVFVGRIDDELKISGQRVDPREVEGALLSHPRVREACVIASADKRLIAYVVADEVDVTELRVHAQRLLLAAAVPQTFVRLPALPRTRSGKIDRSDLRARPVQLGPVSEARSELERQVLATFADVLGQRDLGPEDDFFARGGQSLQTMQVANRLGVALGRELPVALVFRHPSAAALARALAGEQAESELDMLEDAHLPAEVRGLGEPARRLGDVLLTGATGFVGVHLLHALLERTHARVTCLVRAESEARAYERLLGALRRHALRWPDLGVRVRVMRADLSQSQLGLQSFDELAARCDTVFHAAATVSLTRGYGSLRAENVFATRELLRFASTGAAKAFHHVSTIAVGRGDEAFTPAHEGLRDGYTQSKWAAERLVEQARERGVEASVYRLGRVVGPFETGFVNPADIVWRIVRAGVPRGALPVLDVREPWTPVDFLARAMVELASRPPRAPLYNLTPEPAVALAEVFGWVCEFGYELELLALPAWLERLRDARDDDTVATRAFFELQSSERASAPPLRCEQLHRALPDLAVPRIDRSAVHRYLAYAVAHGLLPTPSDLRRTR